MATTSIEPTTRTLRTEDGQSDPKRFRALAVIGIAQLMIVLDASVVTIALPSAQRALHISVANRQWALTAYTLAFGGLAPYRRAGGGLHGPQADVHHQPARFCGCVRARRAGPERRPCCSAPAPCRGVRGHHGAGLAFLVDRHFH